MGSKNKKSSAAAIKRQALDALKFQNMLGMEYTKGRNDGYMISIIIMFWILHNEHGYGKKRLAKMLRQINDFCNEVIAVGPDGIRKNKDGEFQGISLQDIVDELAACGVYIDLNNGSFEVPGVKVIKDGECDV